MGAGASSSSTSTTDLSPDNLPNELFVEGAGSERVNGKFVLRVDKHNFPIKGPSSRKGKFAELNRSIWFSQDDDKGCWMAFIDAGKKLGDEDQDQRKWIICTAQEILYMASITGDKSLPRQGRWEVGDGGTAPAPTVNLQPLPTAFRLSGWKDHHYRLNGEYLPLDDGTELLNQRPIFKHDPVVGVLTHQDKWRMYWSHGAWRIGNKDQLESDQKHCMAFVESDANHPTAMPSEVVWKRTAGERDCGTDESHFEVVDSVSLATGTSVRIYISSTGGGALTSLTVRPWFDTVEDLQSQAFAIDTPSQRQQLVLDGKRLTEDGRVLAQHGLVEECTIQLIVVDKIELLDGFFDESVSVDLVGDPSPPEKTPDGGVFHGAYCDSHYNPADNRIYVTPRCASRVIRFDPTAKTWETFGDEFIQTEFLESCSWLYCAFSSFDNCIYKMPYYLKKIYKMLKIDPATSTAKEVGDDLRTLLPPDVNELGWSGTFAAADGCLFGLPNRAHSVLRFDPRTNKYTTFGQLEDYGCGHQYWTGVLGPSGRYMFGIPATAPRVLRIDTQELTIQLIGPDFGHGNMDNYMSKGKWLGGALGGDNCIYGMLHNARRILRIDPTTNAVSLFGPDQHRLDNKCHPQYMKWIGLATAMDGCMYGPPFLGTHVIRIDPYAGTVSTVGEAPLSGAQRWNGVCDRDGAIWMYPLNSPGRMLRVSPRRPHTALLTTLLQPKHHAVLQEGLRDLQCHGPALATALWLEAGRPGGDLTLVCGLLEAAATVLPTVVTTSIGKHNGNAARMLLKTILATLSPLLTQDNNSGLITTTAEAEKRANIGGAVSATTPMGGVQKQDNYSPPYEAIRALVTDRDVLPQCFAASDELRGMLLRILYGVQSLEDSAPQPTPSNDSQPPTSAQRAITKHLEAEWPDLTAAMRAIRLAPPALSANDRHRVAVLSHFTVASAILQAPAPNAWQPLPASPDEWSWPPAPLLALRAEAKLVQHLGPDTGRAMWPVLASAIASVLVRIVDAVRADIKHATVLLTSIFDRERKSSLGTYQKQLRRVRRDPTFHEFKTTGADLTNKLETLNRKERRVQTTASFPELYITAHAMHKRFNAFLAHLAQKCAGATALQAPLKGIGRALEKLVLAPGVAAKVKAKGLEAVNATTLVDILRGSLECPNFMEIVFILDLLELLDVDLGDPKKAQAQGWDLKNFQIRIINLKDRFTTPTSGGWADAMINFSFAHGDDTHHVMEVQIQHAQMLVVRKEGKAHEQYNSFRSAFELLEAVAHEPNDSFDDQQEELSLQRLEQHINHLRDGMQQQMDVMRDGMQQKIDAMQKKIDVIQQEMKYLKEENSELKLKEEFIV